MIYERTAADRPTSLVKNGMRRPFLLGQHQLVGIGARARVLIRRVDEWVRVQVLPHAALWEASVVVSLLTQEAFETERGASRPPALTDSWLHG